MPRPRVFVTQPVAARALDRLRAVADVAVNPDPLRISGKTEALVTVSVRMCDWSRPPSRTLSFHDQQEADR